MYRYAYYSTTFDSCHYIDLFVDIEINEDFLESNAVSISMHLVLCDRK